MEIVLAVLLLFGGFALGSATAEKNDGAEPSSISASRIQTTADSVLATPGMRGCCLLYTSDAADERVRV